MPKIGRTLSYINTERKGKSTEQSSVSQSLGSSRPGGSISMPQGDYLLKSIWDKVFEIRTDSQGTEYIFGKLPMVTQYGITMYSGDGVDIPSLASGLPFDGRTIWYNPDTQQIEVIGGTGGGSGEGVSNFWDLSGIPSWITNSKPKYTYSEIEGTPDLSGFATQNWITSQGYASAEELKNYIPISGYTEVSGEKNFTGGLKVNGSPIYYDTEKKYWKFEGDLLVTGGVTMYGNEGTFTPSTIMDAILYDDATLGINSNGQLYVKGGTSGGGLDITALQNYLTQNSYLNVTEGDGRYLKLSGGTINGDLFVANSYGGIVFTNTSNNSNAFLFYNGNADWYVTNKDWGVGYKIWHEGNFTPSNYLPLSGGTITGELFVSSTSNNRAKISLISYADVPNNLVFGSNGEYHWSITSRDSVEGRYIGLYNNKVGSNGWVFKANFDNRVLDFMNNPTVNGSSIWHSGNDGSGSGLDADLLDGVQESGFCRHFNGVPITSHRGIGYGFAGEGWISDGPALSIGYSEDNYLMQLQAPADYTALHFRNRMHGAWGSWKEIAFTDSNVASATKLQTARTIWGQSFDGTGNVSGRLDMDSLVYFMQGGTEHGYLGFASSDTDLYLSANRTLFISGKNNLILNGYSDQGNVGIGMASPSAKLHVSGDILATGGITMYSMRKLKNVVDERGLSLNELSTIKPTRYTWKDGRDNRLHFGGIADDIQQVLPEVVYKTGDNVLTMDYGNAAFAIASSLIKPVIDHEQRIVMLERENKELKKELAYVKRELESN